MSPKSSKILRRYMVDTKYLKYSQYYVEFKYLSEHLHNDLLTTHDLRLEPMTLMLNSPYTFNATET